MKYIQINEIGVIFYDKYLILYFVLYGVEDMIGLPQKLRKNKAIADYHTGHITLFLPPDFSVNKIIFIK